MPFHPLCQANSFCCATCISQRSFVSRVLRICLLSLSLSIMSGVLSNSIFEVWVSNLLSAVEFSFSSSMSESWTSVKSIVSWVRGEFVTFYYLGFLSIAFPALDNISTVYQLSFSLTWYLILTLGLIFFSLDPLLCRLFGFCFFLGVIPVTVWSFYFRRMTMLFTQWRWWNGLHLFSAMVFRFRILNVCWCCIWVVVFVAWD